MDIPSATKADRNDNTTASLSSVGRGIANSYLKFDTEEKIDTIPLKIVSTPKSSCEYILAKTILTAKGIICEMVEPENKTRKFLLKSEFKAILNLEMSFILWVLNRL